MYIISKKKNGSGGYPPLQSWNSTTCPNGYYFYPNEFFSIFYKQDKRCAGFVNYEVDETTKTVKNVTWNEEAYQAYIATLPPIPVPTAADKRKQAYETGKVQGDETDYHVTWNGTSYTTDALGQLGMDYEFREEDATANAIREIVKAGIDKIRQAYPDENKE